MSFDEGLGHSSGAGIVSSETSSFLPFFDIPILYVPSRVPHFYGSNVWSRFIDLLGSTRFTSLTMVCFAWGVRAVDAYLGVGAYLGYLYDVCVLIS